MPTRTSKKVREFVAALPGKKKKTSHKLCKTKENYYRAVLEVGNAVNRQSAACKESAIQLYNLILKPIIFNNNIIQMIIN